MRDLTTDQLTAVDAPVVRPVLLCRLDFSSGIVGVHSGVGKIIHGGEEYSGLGSYGGISEVTEGSDARPYDLDLSLSGIPLEFLASTIGEDYQGRAATLFIALLDEDHQSIDTAKQIWSGFMDSPDIELGETATIVVHCRGRANDWNRARLLRYTKEQQRSIYPDDSGLDYVAQMTDKTITWGIL
ncbi:MAG: hypothetical protein PF495_18325 [Spirochaetales bacterium]|nr:hypothetical protein [Spirochaetales bacterium]